MENYRFYNIGTKKIRVGFISTGMGSSDYDVALCGIPRDLPSTRVRKSHEDGIIRATQWGVEDAGLTQAEAVLAVELFLDEKHREYLKWLEENPNMKQYAV